MDESISLNESATPPTPNAVSVGSNQPVLPCTTELIGWQTRCAAQLKTCQLPHIKRSMRWQAVLATWQTALRMKHAKLLKRLERRWIIRKRVFKTDLLRR